MSDKLGQYSTPIAKAKEEIDLDWIFIRSSFEESEDTKVEKSANVEYSTVRCIKGRN